MKFWYIALLLFTMSHAVPLIMEGSMMKEEDFNINLERRSISQVFGSLFGKGSGATPSPSPSPSPKPSPPPAPVPVPKGNPPRASIPPPSPQPRPSPPSTQQARPVPPPVPAPAPPRRADPAPIVQPQEPRPPIPQQQPPRQQQQPAQQQQSTPQRQQPIIPRIPDEQTPSPPSTTRSESQPSMEQSSTIRTDIFGAIEPHPPVPKSKLVSNSQSDDQKKAELKEDEARQSTSNVPMILGICIAVTGALAGIVIGFRVGLARLRRQEQDGMVVGESEGTGIDSTLPDRKSQHLDLLYTSTYQHDYGVQAE